MGVDFAIDVEPRVADTSAITDAEIEAYHREHCPSGEPPLDTIREHVLQAIALGRAALDPVDALANQFVDRFGRYRIWFDRDLQVAAERLQVTPLAGFQVDAPRWCSTEDGLATVVALEGYLRESHPDWTDALACLELVGAILARAASDGRRWRLLAMW